MQVGHSSRPCCFFDKSRFHNLADHVLSATSYQAGYSGGEVRAEAYNITSSVCYKQFP
jgi:hypothetical protein